jgi:hypothetical protein
VKSHSGLLSVSLQNGYAEGARARRGPSSELLVGRPAAGGPPAGRGSSVLAPVLDPLARRAAKRQYGGRTTYRHAHTTRPTPYPQPTYEMRTYSQAHDGDITRNVCESGAERRRRPRDRPATSPGATRSYEPLAPAWGPTDDQRDIFVHAKIIKPE